MPKVSVIVPVYNVEAYVEQCLRSVAEQTYTGSIECIIIDDCGTDGSMDVVSRFVDSYDGPVEFKVVHHEKNRGLSAARNTGMDEATGEYVCFLDSDDYLHPSFIKTLLPYLTTDLGYVECGSYYDKDGIVTPGPWSKCEARIYTPAEFTEKILFKKLPTTVWGTLYRKETINGTRFREGITNEDYLYKIDLSKVFEKKNLSVLLLENKLCYYRLRENSICTSLDNPFFVIQIENLNDVLNALKDYKPALYERMKKYILDIELKYCISLKNKSHLFHKHYIIIADQLRMIDNGFAHKSLSTHMFMLFLCIKYTPHLYSLIRG